MEWWGRAGGRSDCRGGGRGGGWVGRELTGAQVGASRHF